MTHTEESLMALAVIATNRATAIANGDRPANLSEHLNDLRLAIREILAERDGLRAMLKESGINSNGWMMRAERAYAECERNRKDAERGRFMLKHGEWRRNSEYTTAHLAVAVPFNSDLSCYATREAAIDAAMQEGK